MADELNRYTSRKLNGIITPILVHDNAIHKDREYPLTRKLHESVRYLNPDNKPNDYDKGLTKRRNIIAKLKEMGIAY